MLGWLSKLLGQTPHGHTWERYAGGAHKRFCIDCGLVQWMLMPEEGEEHPRWRDVEHAGDLPPKRRTTMADQEKHLKQTKSPEERKAIKGAQNAADNADNAPGTAPTPQAEPGGGIPVDPE